MSATLAPAAKEYGASSIQALEGLEGPRKRPDMYIGDTEKRGWHHCLWEIVDNSVDESLAGHARAITVTLHADGSASVLDDGRGIPVGIHPKYKMSAATVAMTMLHAGGKFDGKSYKTSGGLHGVGASVVNALSTRFLIEIRREGAFWSQAFRDGGKPVGALARGRATKEHGTFTRFWLDPSVFEEGLSFDAAVVRERLRTSAHLNPGLAITLVDETAPDGTTSESFRSQRFSDILDLYAPPGRNAISPVIEGEAFAEPDPEDAAKGKQAVQVYFALRYFATDEFRLASFANNISTEGGGTHDSGMRAGLLRAIKQYAESMGVKDALTAEDVREGLFAAVSIRIGDPKFEAQTKEKLRNTEAMGAVTRTVYQRLQTYFEENPAVARAVVAKAVLTAKGRDAARRAKELSGGDRKAAGGGTSLPGKLSDCAFSDPRVCELFLVEGDSAGGTAKGARDNDTQALLPLRGKILNVHRADAAKALGNQEVKNMVAALGTGIGKAFDIAKLRYHKVILMTDADVDGSHIATLVLTFFHVFMPQLIENGHVYAAQPPLYRAKKGLKSQYIDDDRKLAEFKETHQVGGPGGWDVSRFKGLGEMDAEELAETTMDPAKRRLKQIVYGPGGREADEATFEMLMGREVPPRYAFIEERATYANLDA